MPILSFERIVDHRNRAVIIGVLPNVLYHTPNIEHREPSRRPIADSGGVSDLLNLLLKCALEALKPIAGGLIVLLRPRDEAATRDNRIAIVILVDMAATDIPKDVIPAWNLTTLHAVISRPRLRASI